ALLDVERDALAVLVGLAGPDGNHRALLRLFLGRVGDDDAADFLLFFLCALHEDAVVKRSQRHARYSVLLKVRQSPGAWPSWEARSAGPDAGFRAFACGLGPRCCQG